MSILTQGQAEDKARDWVAAWNRRDLEAVMAHYAEEVEICSPLVVKRLGRADGWLRGKKELQSYFARGMSNEALRFELEDVRLGVNAMVVLYARENGMRVADMSELDAQGLIRRMVACYAGGESDA
ncbi:YybH family protein [Marimonas arenosa]|uniref:Nuclear transport factor 2 family protein n=1 Tax=Marimonas arenosa TaxID=1795305 RepID=A0AAE3WDX4_9RHOB|nr:nuclear transport factor 2 family protein [Marimonas arenosa]MDQ2091471.1 nuclear transport factor 2 family protein [Marimonas arenosa]